MKIRDKIYIQLWYCTLFEAIEELKSVEKKYWANLLLEMDKDWYYIEIIREATTDEQNKLKQKELIFLYKDIEKYPKEALLYALKIKNKED